MATNSFSLSSYDYDLPPGLIAKRPVSPRDHSRLMVYRRDHDEIIHTHFYKIADFLPKYSTLVINESKVFPCRLVGQKISGGEVEVFILTLLPVNGLYQCLIKTTSRKKIGEKYQINDVVITLMSAYANGTFGVEIPVTNLSDFLWKNGKVPIPPYIREGSPDEKDSMDYQTVFAKNIGSVAAPTAGLHFTPNLLYSLEDQGHQLARVTLHVGMGTFTTVKTQDIRDHQMHPEFFSIDAGNSYKLKKGEGNLVAVGSTSLRVLESIKDFSGSAQGTTQIFLHPGNPPKKVCGLITNFHLPKSTLLMMVSSFLGREKTLAIYQEAIRNRYRFYSYGDAMMIV